MLFSLFMIVRTKIIGHYSLLITRYSLLITRNTNTPLRLRMSSFDYCIVLISFLYVCMVNTIYLLSIIIIIISTDEDPSLRIESSAIINLRGVSTKLNKYIVRVLFLNSTVIKFVYIIFIHYSPNRGNCRKMSMLETAELLFSLNANFPFCSQLC